MKYTLIALFFLHSTFVDDISAQNDFSCHQPVDVAVIVDSSLYFGSGNFAQLKLFSKNFISYFELTNSGLNPYIGFVQYSDRVLEKSVINFRYSTSLQRLSGKIDRLNFDDTWGMRLDLALKYARETLFTANKGSRAWVPRVVLAITGSVRYWEPVRRDAVQREAAELRRSGIQLMIASVGPPQGTNGYLKSLVDNRQERLFLLSYPYLLYGISESITKQVCPVPSTFGCPGKVDIAFIADSSGSINDNDYNKMKYFMYSIAKSVNISETGARAGIVIYSRTAELVVKFSDHVEMKGFRDVVYKLKHMKSFTRIDLGLHVAHTQLFSPVYGGARPGVKKIAFILTDGKQTSVDGAKVSLRQAVQPLHDSGVKTLAIGIGPAVERDELRAMVEFDDDVIVAENFDQLIQNIQNITQLTCEQLTITPCNHAADITFLVDSSSDVLNEDFRKMKDFIFAVEKRFRISEFGSRHSVILYGNRAEMSVNMNGAKNLTDFVSALDKLWPIGGRRSSYRALALAERSHDDFENGARRNAPKVVVLITAGAESSLYDTARLSNAAKRSRDKGVVVMVIGIGSGVSRNGLLPLVASSSDLFLPRSFEDLKDETPALSDAICNNIEPPTCSRAIDIAFIIDSSGSIMSDSFVEARNFVQAIAETLTISREKTHVGLMIYSDEARIMAKFNRISSRASLKTELDDLPHLRGKTRIDLALKLASAELFTGMAGMRLFYPKVAVVITDGRQSPAADAIRLDEAVAPLLVRGVKMISVGIGKRIDRGELEMMVKTPDLAFWAASYRALRVQLAAIAREVCSNTLT